MLGKSEHSSCLLPTLLSSGRMPYLTTLLYFYVFDLAPLACFTQLVDELRNALGEQEGDVEMLNGHAGMSISRCAFDGPSLEANTDFRPTIMKIMTATTARFHEEYKKLAG